MDVLCHIREFVPFWTGEAVRIASGAGESWGRDHTNAERLAAVRDTASCTFEAGGGGHSDVGATVC